MSAFSKVRLRSTLEHPIDGQALRPITGGRLGRADHGWGGARNPGVHFWAAAFNHVDWPSLFRHYEPCGWEYPDELQVLISTQESPKLGLFELKGGRLAPVNAEPAIQISTLATEYLEAGAQGEPISEGRMNVPRTADEVEGLIEQVISLLARTPQDVAREVRSLLD